MVPTNPPNRVYNGLTTGTGLIARALNLDDFLDIAGD